MIHFQNTLLNLNLGNQVFVSYNEKSNSQFKEAKQATLFDCGTLHFHYQDIFMLKALDKNNVIDAIENGDIYIDFDARTGHNHGTKFRLRNKALINLYQEAVAY